MDDWNDSDSGLAVRLAELEANNRRLRDRAADLEAALAEARRMEHSLRRDATLLASLQASVIVSDLSGIVTYWNVGATRIFGWTAAERVGRAILEPYTDAVQRSRAAAFFRRILEGEVFVGEWQDRRKDGSPVWLVCGVRRFVGPSGEPAGVIGVSHDITDSKRAEDALRVSESRYRTVSEMTTDLVFHLRIKPDGPSSMEWISGPFARMMGYDLDEYNALGGWPVLCHPDDRPAAEECYRELLLTGRQIEGDTRLRCRSGEYRWMHYVNRPICDPVDGRVTGLLGAARDVTDLKRAETEREQLEQQLRQAHKLESIGVLAGGIAHDFNNLLTVILGNASLLQPVLPAGSPERTSADHILEASRRAGELCAQLLAYAGKGQYVLQRLDLSQLVRDSAHQPLAAVAAAGKAKLQLQPAADLPAMDGDPAQLHQALINLATNAVEAVEGRDGGIRICTGTVRADRALLDACQAEGGLPEGEYVFLEVADSGCGMTSDTAARFDPFFTTKFPGRGLGLAAVHGIVRGHRGGVMVNTTPDSGTTFKLLFPVSLDPPAEVPPPPQQGAILVIEDESGIRELDRMVLEQAGFRVLTACDGVEGLALFREHFVEIQGVLLDLTMPGPSGRQVAVDMHALRPEVPVVLTSGFSGEEVLNRPGQTNVAAFLQKPYTPTELLEVMQRVLAEPRGSANRG